MSRGHFWVGTDTKATEFGTVPYGPMYVEWLKPESVSQPYPVVLVHGGGGQGLDYLGTPDGREGWAGQLADQGYEVYVVDRPGHGRSPHHPDVLGPMGPMMPIEGWIDIMLPAQAAGAHAQWPGGRTVDDAVVLQATASSGPTLADWTAMHELEQSRMAELLDRIGPAVFICHSAGGPAGYLAADMRPDLVKALIAIETIGPPFMKRPGVELIWGLSCAPLTFDPPASSPAELDLTVDNDHGPVPRTMQAEPARQLVNLAKTPIAVVTAETSPFMMFDRHLVDFLEQAGCAVDLIRLGDRGIHGNGHMMMLESNNREVLGELTGWLTERLA